MARAARMARPREVVRRKALASYFRPSLSADTVGQRRQGQRVWPARCEPVMGNKLSNNVIPHSAFQNIRAPLLFSFQERRGRGLPLALVVLRAPYPSPCLSLRHVPRPAQRVRVRKGSSSGPQWMAVMGRTTALNTSARTHAPPEASQVLRASQESGFKQANSNSLG